MRILTILFICISSWSSAQWAVGLFAEPSYQISTLQEFDSPDYDSMDAIWQNNPGLGLGISLKYNFDRVSSIHISPGFYQFGFTLLRDELEFLDVVHSTLDTLFDASQAATKKAYMQHQFRYAGAQVEYHRNITPALSKLAVEFHIGGGIGYYYAIDHRLRVQTEGFAIDEKFVHIIEEDLYFDQQEHLFTASLFLETIYRPTPNWEVFGQLAFRSGLNTLTSGDAQAFNLSPNLRAGFRRLL